MEHPTWFQQLMLQDIVRSNIVDDLRKLLDEMKKERGFGKWREPSYKPPKFYEPGQHPLNLLVRFIIYIALIVLMVLFMIELTTKVLFK